MNPRNVRLLRHVLFFAGVWLLAALLYTLLEFGLLGRLDYYPSTDNPYDFENSLIYTCTVSFIMGTVQGLIEVFWLRRALRRKQLWYKIVFKSLFYIALIVSFILVVAWITNARRLGKGMFDPVLMQSLFAFFKRFAFWSVVIYTGAVLAMAILLAEVSQYLGSGMLANFFLGRYHKPRQETRIFMFLDMNQSTQLAESLGHDTYFRLLREYYAVMSDPILQTGGSIYHYVGDEVVVNWDVDGGLEDHNCIRCFLKIRQAFMRKAGVFRDTFGQVPGFKAAFHMGEVTMGEIGEIKKDLIFTGDVLNTTARILGQCHDFQADALVSESLAAKLPDIPGQRLVPVGKAALRGKSQKLALYRLEPAP